MSTCFAAPGELSCERWRRSLCADGWHLFRVRSPGGTGDEHRREGRQRATPQESPAGPGGHARPGRRQPRPGDGHRGPGPGGTQRHDQPGRHQRLPRPDRHQHGQVGRHGQEARGGHPRGACGQLLDRRRRRPDRRLGVRLGGARRPADDRRDERVGMDASAVGNHEFDKGWPTCATASSGPRPPATRKWDYSGPTSTKGHPDTGAARVRDVHHRRRDAWASSAR